MKKKLFTLSIIFVVIGILAFSYQTFHPVQITPEGFTIDRLGWIVGGYLSIVAGFITALTTFILSKLKKI